MSTRLATLLAAGALALLAAGCGGGGGGGAITADGSSTVGPFTTKAAEDFKAQGGADVTVGISGTGGGFERFCIGETDISNASRAIKDEEAAICDENGVEYVELAGRARRAHERRERGERLGDVPHRRAAERDLEAGLEGEELEPGRLLVPRRAAQALRPGTDSGTFDYFTGEINGEEGASRTDYSPSEDDNVIVQGVAGERGGLGYFGFTYFEENEDTLQALEVDGGDGCVAPGVESAQDGTYTPLSRPLFMYVSLDSLGESEDLREFVRFALENAQTVAEEARFVPLGQQQLDEQLQKLEDAVA